MMVSAEKSRADTLQGRELEVNECLDLLAAGAYGRLAFVVDGEPDILPVNYVFHGGAVVMRVGRGRLLDLLHLTSAVFEIDGVDDEGAWSVIVKGKAEEAIDPDDLADLRDLSLVPWAGGERDHYFRILPRAITGRRLTRPSRA